MHLMSIKINLHWVNLQVLDATFDDIVPLAQTKMPDSISKCFLQADP